ncbi:hypothetical protein [Streptomyces subrutilus]
MLTMGDRMPELRALLDSVAQRAARNAHAVWRRVALAEDPQAALHHADRLADMLRLLGEETLRADVLTRAKETTDRTSTPRPRGCRARAGRM